MKQLQLYAIFYLNLLYSSVPVKSRHTLISNCYWPLLRIIESGIPLGIQISGVSLEIINKLDPAWIKKFSTLLKQRKCEFIGGGYAQVIGPLVPAKLNDINQQLGLITYHKILNIRPAIATISEMAYSSGIVEHYLNHDYKAILIEWNNPKSFHSHWQDHWRYYPQQVATNNGKKINVVWIDTVAFQKFQRYIYQEYSLKEYLSI